MEAGERSVASAEGEGSAPEAPALPPPARRLHSEVAFSDRLEPRHRRREDLVDVVVAFLGIALTWAIGYFANSTTQGVTEDVLRFQLIRDALLLPITLIEGTVVLVAPIAIVVALALRRRLNAILQSIGTALLAALVAWGALILLTLLPTEATAPFRVARYAGIGASVETAIGLNIVVGLAGLLDLGYIAFLGSGAYVGAMMSNAASASSRAMTGARFATCGMAEWSEARAKASSTKWAPLSNWPTTPPRAAMAARSRGRTPCSAR